MPRIDRKLHEGDRRVSIANAPRDEKGRTRRERHQYQPALARKVELLAANKTNQEAIAYLLDMSVDTLRTYYKLELERGAANINSRLFACMVQTALGEREDCTACEGTGGTEDGEVCPDCGGTGEGKRWVREPNTTAQIWCSKNMMGWTDRERIEHVGDGGGPIITEQRSSADTIRARLEKIEKRLNPPANDKAA